MKNKSLEQKNVQNENKMRGNVWKFLWTPKFGQIKMPAARQADFPFQGRRGRSSLMELMKWIFSHSSALINSADFQFSKSARRGS